MFLAANTNYGYKIAILKHNDNQTYAFELKKKKKKKSWPTDPILGGHVTVNTTFFFFCLISAIFWGVWIFRIFMADSKSTSGLYLATIQLY